jgi:pyruvate,orthophosphate dikinase
VELDFVIEDGKLWILQIDRPALSAKSTVSVAADMLRNEIISPEEAICGLEGERLDQVFYPEIDDRSNKSIVFKGKHGSVGVAQGVLYFDYARSQNVKDDSKILLLESSEGIHSQSVLNQFDGFICLKGSINGRLARYARATGKPCIINCPDIEVDWNGRTITSANQITLAEGNMITLDADSCEVLIGDVFLFNPDIGANLKYIISTADQISRMETELIAEKIETIRDGKLVNLSKVGIYDLSSFFFEEEPRELLLDEILKIGLTKFGNSKDELVRLLKNHTLSVLKEVGDNRVNLRLFSDSLNAVLLEDSEIVQLADKINVSENDLARYIADFKDENPEFGLRGSKLLLKHDVLLETQVRSTIEAVIDSRKISFANGGQVGIIVPGISSAAEAKALSRRFEAILMDYNDTLDVEIKLIGEADNVSFLLKMNEMASYFGEICLNLDRITASGYGLSESDNLDSFGKMYDFNPFERFDFETYGDLISNSIRKYKELSKSTVAAYGRFTSNKASVNFFEEAGIDKIYVTKNNSLRTKILAGQACLEKFN